MPRLPATKITLFTIFVSFAIVPTASAQNGWPPEVKNLQFFPTETSFRDLMSTMRGFSFGLGVRCQHCHVGEEGQPLSEFDFASDEKEAKRRARVMLRMTSAINTDHLPGLEQEGELLAVECVTCHRGLVRPEQLDRILVRVALESGAETALEEYASLREEHYGSHSYDFGERTLIVAGEALVDLEKPELAVLLHERNFELFPDSQWGLGSLAQSHLANGNRPGALDALERLLELKPDNPRVRAEIEKIRQMEKSNSSPAADGR